MVEARHEVVIVTGASSGIGAVIALTLAKEGFHVFGIYNRTEPTKREIGTWFKCDLRNPSPLLNEVDSRLEELDFSLVGLVHCAASYGANSRHPFELTTDSEWRELLEVNLSSQFMLTRHWLKRLKLVEAAFILAVSSDVATAPGPGKVAYAVTKAGSYAMFRGLAGELEGTGISVIQIRPKGVVWTPGIERRRPLGFDHSSYADASEFVRPVVEIARTRGLGKNGLVMDV